MTGRKTQAQIIIDMIDKRLKTLENVAKKHSQHMVHNYANLKSESSRPFEDVTFITRDEHRGSGHADLPNSRPIFNLDCEPVPDSDCSRRFGLSDRAWKTIYTHRLDLKSSDNRWIKLDVDYIHSNLAFKTHSNKVVLCGYGNHRTADSSGKPLNPNSVTLSIVRPLDFDHSKPYTSIKSWRFDPWYSRVDLDNQTGIGSRCPSCSDNASPSNPGVESELLDSGDPDRIYIRFRNFYPYPVVVGASFTF